MSMGSLAISVIALGCVFSRAISGIFSRPRLPDKYLVSDSKEVVRLGMGLVVTTAAIALGLLVELGEELLRHAKCRNGSARRTLRPA